MERKHTTFVAGRGVAAYTASEMLAKAGHEVIVSGIEYAQPRTWFVLGNRLTPELFSAIENNDIEHHELSGCRFCVIRDNKMIQDFSISLKNKLPPHSLLMVNDKDVKVWLRNRAIEAGVELVDSQVEESHMCGDEMIVKLKNGDKVKSKIAIDASGSKSILQRSHSASVLSDDPAIMWFYGARVEGQFDPETMVFPLKDRSTGRISWITPWSNTVADVIACDYTRLSQYSTTKETRLQTYRNLVDLCKQHNICEISKEIEPITGMVRIAPIQRPRYASPIFAIGDAAGQACPNMAEGVPPAMRQAKLLAEKIINKQNITPAQYHDSWRKGPKPEQPYNLSAAFAVERMQRETAGDNWRIYKAICESGNPELQFRLLTERKLSINDLPHLLQCIISNKDFAADVINLATRTFFLPLSRDYYSLLYGK